MQLRIQYILWGLLLGAAPLSAVATEAPATQGHATVEFDATSTLHDFTGTAETDSFDVHLEWNGPVATLSATATVAVAAMDTQHAKRDRNMGKMFQLSSFPLLIGSVTSVELDPSDLKPVPLELTVLGKTHTVPLTLTGWQVEEEQLQIQGTLTLSLQTLGLTPPVILGFIRVGDTVAVQISVTLPLPLP